MYRQHFLITTKVCCIEIQGNKIGDNVTLICMQFSQKYDYGDINLATSGLLSTTLNSRKKDHEQFGSIAEKNNDSWQLDNRSAMC